MSGNEHELVLMDALQHISEAQPALQRALSRAPPAAPPATPPHVALIVAPPALEPFVTETLLSDTVSFAATLGHNYRLIPLSEATSRAEQQRTRLYEEARHAAEKARKEAEKRRVEREQEWKNERIKTVSELKQELDTRAQAEAATAAAAAATAEAAADATDAVEGEEAAENVVEASPSPSVTPAPRPYADLEVEEIESKISRIEANEDSDYEENHEFLLSDPEFLDYLDLHAKDPLLLPAQGEEPELDVDDEKSRYIVDIPSGAVLIARELVSSSIKAVSEGCTALLPPLPASVLEALPPALHKLGRHQPHCAKLGRIYTLCCGLSDSIGHPGVISAAGAALAARARGPDAGEAEVTLMEEVNAEAEELAETASGLLAPALPTITVHIPRWQELHGGLPELGLPKLHELVARQMSEQDPGVQVVVAGAVAQAVKNFYKSAVSEFNPGENEAEDEDLPNSVEIPLSVDEDDDDQGEEEEEAASSDFDEALLPVNEILETESLSAELLADLPATSIFGNWDVACLAVGHRVPAPRVPSAVVAAVYNGETYYFGGLSSLNIFISDPESCLSLASACVQPLRVEVIRGQTPTVETTSQVISKFQAVRNACGQSLACATTEQLKQQLQQLQLHDVTIYDFDLENEDEGDEYDHGTSDLDEGEADWTEIEEPEHEDEDEDHSEVDDENKDLLDEVEEVEVQETLEDRIDQLRARRRRELRRCKTTYAAEKALFPSLLHLPCPRPVPVPESWAGVGHLPATLAACATVSEKQVDRALPPSISQLLDDLSRHPSYLHTCSLMPQDEDDVAIADLEVDAEAETLSTIICLPPSNIAAPIPPSAAAALVSAGVAILGPVFCPVAARDNVFVTGAAARAAAGAVRRLKAGLVVAAEPEDADEEDEDEDIWFVEFTEEEAEPEDEAEAEEQEPDEDAEESDHMMTAPDEDEREAKEEEEEEEPSEEEEELDDEDEEEEELPVDDFEISNEELFNGPATTVLFNGVVYFCATVEAAAKFCLSPSHPPTPTHPSLTVIKCNVASTSTVVAHARDYNPGALVLTLQDAVTAVLEADIRGVEIDNQAKNKYEKQVAKAERQARREFKEQAKLAKRQKIPLMVSLEEMIAASKPPAQPERLETKIRRVLFSGEAISGTLAADVIQRALDLSDDPAATALAATPAPSAQHVLSVCRRVTRPAASDGLVLVLGISQFTDSHIQYMLSHHSPVLGSGVQKVFSHEITIRDTGLVLGLTDEPSATCTDLVEATAAATYLRPKPNPYAPSEEQEEEFEAAASLASLADTAVQNLNELLAQRRSQAAEAIAEKENEKIRLASAARRAERAEQRAERQKLRLEAAEAAEAAAKTAEYDGSEAGEPDDNDEYDEDDNNNAPLFKQHPNDSDIEDSESTPPIEAFPAPEDDNVLSVRSEWAAQLPPDVPSLVGVDYVAGFIQKSMTVIEEIIANINEANAEKESPSGFEPKPVTAAQLLALYLRPMAPSAIVPGLPALMPVGALPILAPVVEDAEEEEEPEFADYLVTPPPSPPPQPEEDVSAWLQASVSTAAPNTLVGVSAGGDRNQPAQPAVATRQVGTLPALTVTAPAGCIAAACALATMKCRDAAATAVNGEPVPVSAFIPPSQCSTWHKSCGPWDPRDLVNRELTVAGASLASLKPAELIGALKTPASADDNLYVYEDALIRTRGKSTVPEFDVPMVRLVQGTAPLSEVAFAGACPACVAAGETKDGKQAICYEFAGVEHRFCCYDHMVQCLSHPWFYWDEVIAPAPAPAPGAPALAKEGRPHMLARIRARRLMTPPDPRTLNTDGYILKAVADTLEAAVAEAVETRPCLPGMSPCDSAVLMVAARLMASGGSADHASAVYDALREREAVPTTLEDARRIHDLLANAEQVLRNLK